MRRRAFLAALPALTLAPKVPELRGRTRHVVFLDETAYMSLSQQRRIWRNIYNQPGIVDRAIHLHANFPISVLTLP